MPDDIATQVHTGEIILPTEEELEILQAQQDDITNVY